MLKKGKLNYLKPESLEMELQETGSLLAESVKSVESGGIFDDEITGGSGDARSREGLWDSSDFGE